MLPWLTVNRACLLMLVVLVTLAVPTGATALPGDPPVTAVAPADGASFKVDGDGIPAVIGCPTYRDFDFGYPYTTHAFADSYRVLLARSPLVGADGLLADPVSTSYPRQHQPADDLCDVRLGDLSSGFVADRPQTVPGTYYWQPYRPCSGCELRVESGQVRRIVLTTDPASVKLAIKPPKRAYAGHDFLLDVELAGASETTPITLQRRGAKGRWVSVRSINARRSTAQRIARLPRGKQRLRARVSTPGSGTVTSATRTVRVLSGRSGTPRSDGSYRDRKRPSLRAKIDRGGRRLRGFSALVTASCPTVDPITHAINLNPRPFTVTVPPVRIAPDGRFVIAGSLKAQDVHVSGRLTRGRLRGTVSYAAGACAGSIKSFDARRR